MATCDYSCNPDKKINEDNLNEDTYNEYFISMNSEKILQRIRMLMKESFFYKKDVLISAIQTPKKYPYVQIYFALTQLIEDNNEFIADKYGRNGRLVNIGEYYLFQPLELKDKQISIFDRVVPIDYKRESIEFKINKNIVDRTKQHKDIVELEKELYAEGKKVFEEIKQNFNVVLEFSKEIKVPRGEDDWYKYCGIVIRKIKQDFPEISEVKLLEFLAAHMIEVLLFQEKIDLIAYLYSLEHIERTSLEWYLKEYFDRNMIVTKDFNALLLYKLNKRVFMILNKDNLWVEAQPEDERDIEISSEGAQYFSEVNINEYNKIVGFVGYEKKNKYLVFKTKNMTSTRDTGARCDEAGKGKTIALLNEIIGEDKYTNEGTKMKKDEEGNIVHLAVNQIQLCVLQEFILRYYNYIRRDGKKWFLTPELAIYYKLYKIFV